MANRLFGLSDEQRLEFEQATGIKTETAQIIIDASVQQAQTMMDDALKEIQTVIGPHGAVTRLQAGGVNIARNGIGIFTDGVLKTTIDGEGNLTVGSNIDDPVYTTLCAFVNDQVYNNESMGAGDLLIGDNSAANVKYDASEGQLQFRDRTTINVYLDTDGKLYSGGGAVILDSGGLTLSGGGNDVNLIKWVDALQEAYLFDLSSQLEGDGTVDTVVNTTADVGEVANLYLQAWGNNAQNSAAQILLIGKADGTGEVQINADVVSIPGYVRVFIKTVAPTENDDEGDGYLQGDMWIDTVGERIYQAKQVNAGAAVWYGYIYSLGVEYQDATTATPDVSDYLGFLDVSAGGFRTVTLTDFKTFLAYQPLDAELSALAGLVSAADKFPFFTGSGTASLLTIVSAIRTVLASADLATFRSNAGLAIGTNVQAFDAELAALAGLTSAADKLPYFTGSGTAALADFTTAGRALVDDADASAQRTTLGLGGAAVLNVGTGAGDVAAGNKGVTNGDSHDHNGGDGAAITDANLSTSDITTNNATTSKHGFVVKATAPAANVLNVVGIANGETDYTNKAIFDSTNPAAIGTAAPGTSLVAARRDHVHAAAYSSLSGTPTIPAPENKLNNGGFQLFRRQEHTSPATLTSYSDDTYCFDRWYALTQTASVQVARTSGDNSEYACQLKQNQASAQRMGIAQIIPKGKSISMRGQTVIFQARIKSSTTTAMRVAVLEWTGTADAVTSDVVNSWTNGTFTAGQFFNSTSITVVGVSATANATTSYADFTISGSVSTSCNNLIVFAWTENTAAQNVTVDITKAGFYANSALQVWQEKELHVEIADCGFYFRSWVRPAGNTSRLPFGSAISTTDCIVGFSMPMRASPTASISGTVQLFETATSGGTNVTSVATAATDDTYNSFNVTFTTASGLTAGRSYFPLANAANAYVWLDAEL